MRDAIGLTQEEVARRARITAKYLSQVENGHSIPSVDVFMRLVELGLETPLATFFGGERQQLDDDGAALVATLAQQSPAVRRRAIRVLRALLDE